MTKRVYAFSEFGGALDKEELGQPHIGAFRQFIEEFLGLEKNDALTAALALWETAKHSLVGGAPLLHKKNYAMFLVPAEVVVGCFSLPGTQDESAIDTLFNAGKHNSQLTSLALVSIEELLKVGFRSGKNIVTPLDARDLDDVRRDGTKITLHGLMVGVRGSVSTCSSFLQNPEMKVDLRGKQIDDEAQCGRGPELSGFREIRAIHTATTIRVYQAYSDKIADAVVAGNSFRAAVSHGWSETRMTWVKPSAVWMAYRCGWSVMKDPNQRRVLALDLSREKFEALLLNARLSHHGAKQTEKCKDGIVTVQWDPERCMNPKSSDVYTTKLNDVRSIQIGLRGAGSQMLGDPDFVLRITDVTEDFRKAHAALSAETPDLAAAEAALWPEQKEERMEVPPELREVLKMDANPDR